MYLSFKMYLSKIQNVFVGFQRSGTNQCSTISCSTETASIPVSHMLLLIFITLQHIVAVLLMTLASIMFELVLFPLRDYKLHCIGSQCIGLKLVLVISKVSHFGGF